MAAENDDYRRMLMSEQLRDLTENIVFEGVTPKSGMRKVKAMKRLWRSDSFQVMKSILEEPPIQEGRARQTNIPLKDDDDEDLDTTEASRKDTAFEKESKEKEEEFAKKKEELIQQYQECLESDMELLQSKNAEIVKILVQKARAEVEETEVGHLDDVIKKRIILMMQKIKCHKKTVNKKMKMAVEEDRIVMTAELQEYLDKECDIRFKTYRKLMDEVYEYKLRMLEESLTDEYENKIRQRIRMSVNKFEYAKDILLKRLKKDLEYLECRLAAEFTEHKKWSENRVNKMLEEEIKKIEESKASEKVTVEESECSLKLRLQEGLRCKGWLPWEPSKDEDWSGLVQELMRMYQIFIEYALGEKNTTIKQNEYLLSMEKLTALKNQMAQVTKGKLIDIDETRQRRKTRARAKLRAASLLDYLIKQFLPSPQPSRFSFSDIVIQHKCDKTHSHGSVKKHSTGTNNERKRSKSKSLAIQQDVAPYAGLTSGRASNPLELPIKTTQETDNQEESTLGKIYSEEDRNTFFNVLHDNPQLYNVFFFNL